MKILSFDGDKNFRIKRDTKQFFLFNLFQKNLIYKDSIPVKLYVVPREFEMRLDRISEYIYGTTRYVEELMILNDLINPYCIKEGQYIYYCPEEMFDALHTSDPLIDENENDRKIMLYSSQTNREKTKDVTSKDNNLPPTIKPSNLEQIKVSKDYKVQIINSYS